jgi:hypothetical protein
LENINSKKKARATANSNILEQKSMLPNPNDEQNRLQSVQQSSNFVTPLPVTPAPSSSAGEGFQLDIELPAIVIHSDDYQDELSSPPFQKTVNEHGTFSDSSGKFDFVNGDEKLGRLNLNIAGPTTKELDDFENDNSESQSEDSSGQEDDYYDHFPPKGSFNLEQKGIFAPKQTVFLSPPQTVSSDQHLSNKNEFPFSDISSEQEILDSQVFVTPPESVLQTSERNTVNFQQNFDDNTDHSETERIDTLSSTTKAPNLVFSTLLPPSSLQPSPNVIKEEGFLGLVYASSTTKKPRTSYKNNAPAPSTFKTESNTDTSQEKFEKTSEEGLDDFDVLQAPNSLTDLITPRASLTTVRENTIKYSPPPEAAFAPTYKAPLIDEEEEGTDIPTFSNLLEVIPTSLEKNQFPSTLDSSSTSPSDERTLSSQSGQSTFENVFLAKSTENPQPSTENIGISDSYGSPIGTPVTNYLPNNDQPSTPKELTSYLPQFSQTTVNPQTKQPSSRAQKKGIKTIPEANPTSNANVKHSVSAAGAKPKGPIYKKTTGNPQLQITTETTALVSKEHKSKIQTSSPAIPHSSNRPAPVQKPDEPTGVYDWPITSDPTIIDFTQDHQHPTIRKI